MPIPGEEDCLISEAADVPITQPLLTIIEADMAAIVGNEGLQVPANDPSVATTEQNTAASKGKQKKITSDDVLRLYYETLQCKKETLKLKKTKLELQVKLLGKQLL